MTDKTLGACEECGCTDIQVTAWIEFNTHAIQGDDGPTDQVWCPQCESETCFAFTDTLKPYRE
jgi:hypothetical protein